MAEDKKFHIFQLRSILLSSTGHRYLCSLLSFFVADRDFKISKIKHFHTSTKPDMALAEYFANFPNEIQQIFGRRPSLRNQHVLYRNPSTKDIRIEIRIEQFDIPSLIIILTHNNHFQGIPKNLRKTLSYIYDFHKLSLATSKNGEISSGEWNCNYFPTSQATVTCGMDLLKISTLLVKWLRIWIKMREKYGRREKTK